MKDPNLPKLVPTIAITVVRDGVRKTPQIGKAFDFTDEEVKSVRAQMPTAFRKPVNEDDSATGTDATAPDANSKPTATKTAKRPKAETAAKKSATSDAATGGDGGNDSETADDGDDDDDI